VGFSVTKMNLPGASSFFLKISLLEEDEETEIQEYFLFLRSRKEFSESELAIIDFLALFRVFRSKALSANLEVARSCRSPPNS
jgi:hypothetical protein